MTFDLMRPLSKHGDSPMWPKELILQDSIHEVPEVASNQIVVTSRVEENALEQRVTDNRTVRVI